METYIILGPQGSGKSTLAAAILPDPDYHHNPAKGANHFDMLRFFAEKLRDRGNSPAGYSFVLDEADVFFSLLNTKERTLFKNFWALARHTGLVTAVFIARRYVQIPIFARSSATRVYLSLDARNTQEMKLLDKEGFSARFFPGSQGKFLFQEL